MAMSICSTAKLMPSEEGTNCSESQQPVCPAGMEAQREEGPSRSKALASTTGSQQRG